MILVTVRSLLAGKKFLTPEIRFSKFAPRFVVRLLAIPEAPRRSVRRPPMDVKLLKRLEPEEAWCEVVEGWRVVVIIVMRVVARTLLFAVSISSCDVIWCRG